MGHSALEGLITDRLTLHPLVINDSRFILGLVNTPGWLKFIGDRNVKTITDAEGYIRNILDNLNAFYWVVKLKNNYGGIGVITFLKRSYLEHFDLGFAFMPGYHKQGYAFEAAAAVLKMFPKELGLKQVQGVTDALNISSVNLLERLGFIFDQRIEIDNKSVGLYSLVLAD